MPSHPTEAPSAFNIAEIPVAILKYKWLILICATIGIGAAAAVYLLYPKVYQSTAKLMVRYVVDRSAIDPEESAQGMPARRGSDSVLANEVAILSSTDLAVQVAKGLDSKETTLPSGRRLPKEITPGNVAGGIDVEQAKGSNIIVVSYTNPDREVAAKILNEYINQYFAMHLEIHRSAAAFEFVSKQADQARLELSQTEDELKQLKAKVGIVSLADGLAAAELDIKKLQDSLHDAEAAFAEQKAVVSQFEKPGTASSPQTKPAPEKEEPQSIAAASPAEKQQYQTVVARLSMLEKEQINLLSRFTPGNQLVVTNQQQIDDLSKQRASLEAKYPDLASTASQVISSLPSANLGAQTLGTERARMLGLEARIAVQKKRLEESKAAFAELSSLAPQISQLERQKQLLETNFQNFGTSLEKARIEEALDPSKIPNISIIQKPSGAGLVIGFRDKIALGLAGGGLALGILIACALELGLNRTIKRPLDLETKLHIPLLASIPYSNTLSSNKGPKSGPPTLKNATGAQVAPWDPAHYMHPFCAGLRDRLGLFFQLNNITHKPKLVGVTGFTKGAGTSTIATGLAAALSETGDGKVLLVNMNVNHADVHPFFEGRPTMNLDAAIRPQSEHPEASENLYLATTRTETGTLASQGLKRFHSLLPQFEASDYDYIIFDLPPLGQTSPTVAMAGLMDKVLLVVESEKSDPNAIKRGYAELIAAKANVSAVFNKEKSYLPKWLKGSDA